MVAIPRVRPSVLIVISLTSADPDEQVLACYEPAYQIITCFLSLLR